MKEILIKLALSILSDKEAREKITIVILSIVVGVLLLLLAPVAVLFSLGEIEAPEVSGLDESAYIASLDSEQQAKLTQMETDGQTIAEVMKSLGIQEQTIKAQLLYFSFFSDTELTDYLAYGNLFKDASDDAALIENINQTYGLDIVYEDFMQSYTWVMNTTINEYLFTDAATKNKPDLAAWARNAYVSGWAYRDGAIGEIDTELRYRCADNAGLILGYLRYNPTEKVFGTEQSVLYYTVKGNLDTIGKMYCYGLGTEQNYAKSFGWFMKSAIAGNRFAQFSLANQYYYGNGFYKDKEQALHWCMKSAEQGLPYAAYAVAQMYANGEAILQDEATAQQYYAQALAGFLKLEESDHADDNLLYKLGRMYRYGLGTEEDVPKALEYFTRSAKHGNTNARRMIAIEQLSGEHIPRNVNKAVEILTELAENGDAVSAYRLGKLYLFGTDGIERDVPQAKQWLTMSAEDGNEYAQQLLDSMEQRENAAFASSIFGLFVNLSRMIEDDYNKSHKKLQSKVDSKIQRMIRKHKQELGIREEHGITMQ